MKMWVRRFVYALVLLLCLGCGSESEAPGNIPIVLSNGRFGESDTAVATTAAPAEADAPTPRPESTAPVAAQPTPLAEPSTGATVSPTRTLTETLEELVGTPVTDATTEATETTLGDETVGALQVSVLGVRVAALDASLTDPGDNRALVVRVRFQNPTERAILVQFGSETALRDAAGTEYAPDFIARTSARAVEPDTLVTPGGNVEGEIAFLVPNETTTFALIVRSGGTQSSFALPSVPAGEATAEPSASAVPLAETTTAEPE